MRTGLHARAGGGDPPRMGAAGRGPARIWRCTPMRTPSNLPAHFRAPRRAAPAAQDKVTGALVTFCTCLRVGRTVIAMWVGTDYNHPRARAAATYFNLLYEVVRVAIAEGAAEVDLGAAHRGAKVALGFKARPVRWGAWGSGGVGSAVEWAAGRRPGAAERRPACVGRSGQQLSNGPHGMQQQQPGPMQVAMQREPDRCTNTRGTRAARACDDLRRPIAAPDTGAAPRLPAPRPAPSLYVRCGSRLQRAVYARAIGRYFRPSAVMNDP